MGLDAMYGAGTASELAKRADISSIFPGATTTVKESETEDGLIAVDLTWKDPDGRIGQYRLQFNREEVRTTSLDVEPTRRSKGILTFLIRQMNDWWASIGITKNTMYVRPESLGEVVLRLAGFDYLDNHEFGSPIPGPRLAEFVEWAEAGEDEATEPEWRKELQHVVGVF
jgi:GNAT superfamily N-acetyltransferase